MLEFLQNSSNQRKIAVAVCAVLAVFSSKIPILADVNPDKVEWLIGAIAVWIGQSGVKAAMQAHADGAVHAAMVANADDAVKVFNQLAALPSNSLVPVPAPSAPAPVAVK